MAQKTFISEILTASDVNTFLMGEGGAWTSWTPVVTQGVNVTVTNTRSRFARYGRTIHFQTRLAVTGTGTAANVISITLPATAASSNVGAGGGNIVDLGASTYHVGEVEFTSTTAFSLIPAVGGVNYLGAVGFTAALAAGDTITVSGTYEAAS